MSCLNLTTMSMQILNSILGLGSEVFVLLVKVLVSVLGGQVSGLVNIPAAYCILNGNGGKQPWPRIQSKTRKEEIMKHVELLISSEVAYVSRQKSRHLWDL